MPVTSLLVGEGGALALAAPDNLWATLDSYFSVIAPETPAAILYRDRERGAGDRGAPTSPALRPRCTRCRRGYREIIPLSSGPELRWPKMRSSDWRPYYELRLREPHLSEKRLPCAGRALRELSAAFFTGVLYVDELPPETDDARPRPPVIL